MATNTFAFAEFTQIHVRIINTLAPARAQLHELHPLDYSVYLVPTAPDTMTNSCHVWNICLRTSRARKVLCEGSLHILI